MFLTLFFLYVNGKLRVGFFSDIGGSLFILLFMLFLVKHYVTDICYVVLVKPFVRDIFMPLVTECLGTLFSDRVP